MPILLLHGLFMDHGTWREVGSTLSDGHRVVAPDLPGFGQSEKPAEGRFPYDFDAFSNAVLDLYAGLDLGRSILVGHGLGGAVAITLAARHPELISRLVLVDALCYPTPLDPLSRVALAPLVGGFAFKQLWGRTTFRAYFRDRFLSSAAPNAHDRLEHYYDAFNTPAARASALATLRATRDTRAVVADVARISVPTLVIWGREDALFPAAHGQRMAREIREAGFQLVEAGHSPQEERPSVVADTIRRFASGLRPK